MLLRRPDRLAAALFLVLAASPGCRRAAEQPEHGQGEAAKAEAKPDGRDDANRAGRFKVASPTRRDIRLVVIQPGTVQSYETTPIFARIAGYVKKYNANIGDRVKANDVLVEMWVPDVVEQHQQRAAMARLAAVNIRVAESSRKSSAAMLETSKAQVAIAEAGVKRAQAEYDRWDSEYRRTTGLVQGRVLDQQVRDETYRQLESAGAQRDQAAANVRMATASVDRYAADLEKAGVDIESARAQLEVNQSEERLAQVMLEYGTIRAPYDGMITQRNTNPGDYIQPGGNGNNVPLFVLEQVDPVRIFVGVPELSSGYIRPGDTAILRLQALPGRAIEGKVVRSGFALNPTSRTLQTEIDVANPEGLLRPSMYVTASITIDRPNVFALPSQAIRYEGQRAITYRVVDGKARRTLIQVGPSTDAFTEVIQRQDPDHPENWLSFDGSEVMLVGNFDSVQDGMVMPATK